MLERQSSLQSDSILVTKDHHKEYKVDYIPVLSEGKLSIWYIGRMDDMDQTWELLANLSHAKKAISNFHA